MIDSISRSWVARFDGFHHFVDEGDDVLVRLGRSPGSNRILNSVKCRNLFKQGCRIGNVGRFPQLLHERVHVCVLEKRYMLTGNILQSSVCVGDRGSQVRFYGQENCLEVCGRDWLGFGCPVVHRLLERSARDVVTVPLAVGQNRLHFPQNNILISMSRRNNLKATLEKEAERVAGQDVAQVLLAFEFSADIGTKGLVNGHDEFGVNVAELRVQSLVALLAFEHVSMPESLPLLLHVVRQTGPG